MRLASVVNAVDNLIGNLATIAVAITIPTLSSPHSPRVLFSLHLHLSSFWQLVSPFLMWISVADPKGSPLRNNF